MVTAQMEEMNASQKKQVTAQKQYSNYAYIDAIKTYERIAIKGYKSVDLFSKLGNAYYFNGQSEKANKWYSDLFAMQQEVEAEYYYRYSQTLKTVKDYKKADEMLTLFNVKSGNDQRAKLFEQEKNYLETVKSNSGRYTVDNLNINGDLIDYGSTVYDNKLIFASSRDLPAYTKRTIKWNNQPFTNLYTSEINTDGSLGIAKLFSNKINSRYDESTPVFTKDGKTVYFTRSNSYDRKLATNVQGTTGLKIYKSKFENNKWTEAVALPFNSDQFSTAHPALSPDDKILYFSSDMPGSIGESDLFKVSIDGNESYGTPMNLGKNINTPGRETFAFVSGDNELYFASDARQGLGGLDIYTSKINADGTFTAPINIGEPVNSNTDDFAFYIDSKTKKGYFSSNRSNGKGYDDIYSLTELTKLRCVQALNGVITDEQTKQIIPYAQVILSDSKMNKIAQIEANDRGEYKFDVNCGEQYYIKTFKQDYETKEMKATIVKTSGKTTVDIAIGKKIIEMKADDDIFVKMGIKIIYFDLDRSFIRQDAALELEKVLDVMNQYPNMVVDVRSHTDSRQTTDYNAALSKRRAKATIEWLVNNGLAKARLTAKGYGESQLVNKCADGIDCTEEEHQANRRSEFIIMKL